MNHAALLEQLQIDRTAEPRARTGALRFLAAAA
jgi:hypothetical protein